MGERCRRARVVMGVCLLLARSDPAAASLRAVPDDVLARSSAAAVQGVVVGAASRWDDRAAAIYTFVTIAVERSWGLGAQPPVVVLKQLGGVVGARALVVGGQARFAVGEEVLVFLDVRPRDHTLSVAGLEQGKWTRRPTSTLTSGAGSWVRDLQAPVRQRAERMPADLEALAALAGTRVDAGSAQLAPAFGPIESTPVPVVATSLPTHGRWHEADEGAPVMVDTAHGGQPQLPGGGLAQLSNAAALWSHAGSLRLEPGVTRAARCFTNSEPFDGRISVSYGDPCDEIADSSATLAIGGAYFSAEDVRTVAGAPFWKLTKGMVVTDGAAWKFASLPVGCYEQLLAHELGHAIGLDHATSGPAVMQPWLAPGCAGSPVSMPLGAPDRAAMDAVYPEAASPPIGLPAPPTGLVASVVGSTVAIQWDAPAGPGLAYEMRVGSRPGASDVAVGVVSPAGVVVPDVAPGLYVVRVVARGPAGDSEPTPDLAIRVAAPSDTTPFADAWSMPVRLTWTPAPPSAGPVSYLVLAGHRPGAIDYQMPSPVAFLQVPAVGAGAYYVRVVAVGPAGLTPLTPEIVVVVPGTPPPTPARPSSGIG